MDIKSFARENLVRILALVCLVIGLSDAARLLGVSSGSANPINILGVTGFVLLTTFTLARLFAAVGLWINSSWGGVMLIGATIVELGLAFSGSAYIHISFPGMLIRLGLFVGIAGFLGMRHLQHRAHVHD